MLRSMRWLCLILLLVPELSAQNLASLHFKPKDHALGDVHPFFKDGQCFLFYLKPGRFESALATSRDFLDWKPRPLTHAPTEPGDWFSPYFVLGVFQDEAASLFRSFYGHAKGRMVSSTSTNLLHWSCAPQSFSIPPGDYHERRRDPFVFQLPDGQGYGCVMTTWMKGRSKEKGGAVSLATSKDLQTWTDHGPIINPGDIGEPECPQMFVINDRWFLLASIYDRAVGKPVYWSSRSPHGPWPKRPEGALDGKDLCAAQIATTQDGSRLLFGWVPLLPARPGAQTWGGHLALVREIQLLPDGRLGTRLAPSLAAHLDALPSLPIECESLSLPADVPWMLQGEVQFANASSLVALKVTGLASIDLRPGSLRILGADGTEWNRLDAAFPLATSLPLRLIVEQDIIEVFVSDRISLAARVPAARVPAALAETTPQLSIVKDDSSMQRLRLTRIIPAPSR